ncbi:MAG: LacI family DNA-binding transcriptional regulator [Eubacteriales bacterium]|nr:LacI family DNA-binding transcriptional regulator [Eubacteriales bacterium]
MKKIAELSGVSISTVSRVLNNPDYKCSSPEVRDRIFRAARQLNYVPNEAARNLKKGIEKQNKILYIGILMTRGEKLGLDPFFHELLRMIEGEIHRNMCILSAVWYEPIFSGNAKAGELDHILENMFSELKQRLDGFIIIGRCDRKAMYKLRRCCRNIISVNRNSTNYEVDEVLCDGKKIASLAVEHLIHLGHRDIGYAGACRDEARFRGYQQTLEKYSIPINPDFVHEAQAREEDGFQLMEHMIHSAYAPTAIYCANDIIAVGMLKCLNKTKNRYYSPSIISSDDIEEARYTRPMLTTVHLPIQEMARYTLQMLLDRINGGHKSVLRMEIECALIIRESCSRVENAMECEYYI